MSNFATNQSISRFINQFRCVFFGKLPQTISKRIISFEETRKFEEKLKKTHFVVQILPLFPRPGLSRRKCTRR